MGTLRFLFAFSVVFSHLGISFLLPGRIAVELFFVTSGYLIAGIIRSGKYSSRRNFIFSRLVRIYPLYFVILILSLITNLFVGNQEIISIFDFLITNDNFFLIAYSILVNILIFGQDLLFFVSASPKPFTFVSNYLEQRPYLNQVLLVPQSWTLSLELYFYILFSYVCRYKKILIVLFIGSFILRFYFFGISIGNQEPWDYRFFPLEIEFFLLGVIISNIFNKYRSLLQTAYMRLAQITLYMIFLVSLLSYSFYKWQPINATIFYVLLYLPVLPIAAEFNRKNDIDNYLGQLSYPIYISHILIIHVFGAFYGNYQQDLTWRIFVVLVMLPINAILLRFIVEPIEKYRKRFMLSIH